ncbi:hypothetical protein PFISCL1PPCAC_22742, partial [Pristionchus fissidentatus]
MSTPHQPDCKHSANGVCSKCVLFRSFDINNKTGRSDSTEKENTSTTTSVRSEETPSTSRSSECK